MPLAKPAWPILQRGDPLSVGLVGAWPFYEGGGNTLNDLSGNAYNAALTNSPSWVGSDFGSALSLNGTNQAGSAASTPYSATVSYFTWIKRVTLGTQFQAIAAHHTTDGSPSDWYIYFGGTGGTDNLIHIDIPWVASDVCISNSTVADTEWHHVGFTRSGSTGSWTYKIYIDRRLDKTGTNASNPNTGAQTLNFGALNASVLGHITAEKVAQSVLYNRVLSLSEVAQLYFDSFSIYRPKRRVPWFTVAGGAGSQNLAPSLFSNSNVFFSPTVAAGAINLTPGLFTDPDTFFAPTVGRGAVTLTPSLFTDPDTFFSPTVTVAGAQALAPSLFTNQGIFYLPVVRSHIVLVNVWVRLTEPHEFNARVWPKDTVFGPDQATVPADFNYTPLMEGYSTESQAAIAQVKIDVWGRYDSHGNLLDNPPLARPIWDPQPTPPVGNKHLLPLGNTC